MTFALVAVIVVLVAVIGWLLRPAPSSRRGGTLDLVPAAARGELDLDWSDPRDLAAQRSRIATADADHAKIVADWRRRAGLTSENEIRFDVDQQTGDWLVLDESANPARLTATASG